LKFGSGSVELYDYMHCLYGMNILRHLERKTRLMEGQKEHDLIRHRAFCDQSLCVLSYVNIGSKTLFLLFV